MAPPILNLQNIHLSYGGTPLIAGADLSIAAGERLCLVGRNGSGKSTLLKIAAGLLEADQGSYFVQPGTTIRYLPQEPNLDSFSDILSYVEAGLSPGDDLYRARYCLENFGLSGSEDPKTLSGGELRRAALARILAPQPDILLLDEPTNHLDLPTIEWLESELKSLRSAFILISHDRKFLEALSQETIWLDRGITRRLPKGFAAFEEWRDAVFAQEELEAHKLDRKLVAEADWLRYGVTARRKRNVRRLTELHNLRKKRAEIRFAPGRAVMNTSEAEASGTLVLEADHVSKSFDDRSIVKDFSFRLLRGDRIGLVGANGTGKTTLLNLLTGKLDPDSGIVMRGSQVEMVVMDQNRQSLDPDATIADILTGGRSDMVPVGNSFKHVIGYMKDYLFAPEQAKMPVRVLSGGEKNRLMIARALAQKSNLLVLDEPTNDLDLETLDLLQEVVADYPGTVLLVSHDRDFLDRTVSSVLVAEGNGIWQEYAGGYTDMLTQRGHGVATFNRSEHDQALSIEGRKETGDKKNIMNNDMASRKKKLSFNETHELKILPEKIAQLEQKIEKYRQILADSSLYSTDPERFNKASEALVACETDLQQAEDRWLALEVLKDELQS